MLVRQNKYKESWDSSECQVPRKSFHVLFIIGTRANGSPAMFYKNMHATSSEFSYKH
jgi:hypothetical protein